MTGKDLAMKTAEALNKKDRGAFLALHHPDVELTSAGGITLKGPEAAADFGWSLVEGFPDMRLTTTSVISEGNLVCVEQVIEGTHTAPLRDPSGKMPPVPPTGKRVVLKGAVIFRMQDGLVREIRVYNDNMALMAQLGLLPAPASA